MKHMNAAPLLLLATMAMNQASGQWCIPNTLEAYNANMPGITRFQLNTIDRTSADLESMTNNYVNTGLSTTLVKGQTYPVTFNFTIDGTICPDMNLRVWIDMNHDGQLDDVGETLLLADHNLPTSYTGSITIPNNAMLGATRMRVTAKMSDLGGHINPTPCDLPLDPFGYHGEMEDYDVTIVEATGINEQLRAIKDISITVDPAGAAQVRFDLMVGGAVLLRVLDGSGRVCAEVANGSMAQGIHSVELPALNSGFYVVQLIHGNEERALSFSHVR